MICPHLWAPIYFICVYSKHKAKAQIEKELITFTYIAAVPCPSVTWIINTEIQIYKDHNNQRWR